MRAYIKLLKRTEIIFLTTLSFVFFLLRLPSLFEPYWYGDEGIYEVIGYALRHGRLLYRGIWDNKPPALYIIYALFNGNQPFVKLISLLTGIVAIILFFFVAKKLFTNPPARFFSTILFTIIFGLPVIEGNIANAENFMIPLTVGAALLILNVEKLYTIKQKKLLTHTSRLLFLAGLLLGLAFLIKVVAVFDLAAFTLFLLIATGTSVKQILKHIIALIPLYVGFIIPFLTTIIFFVLKNALHDYITSAFLSNVGYVNYGNQFIIPQGLLIGKLIVLFGICLFVFFRRKHFSPTALFVYLWLAFSVFNALFSQRPYAHYLQVLLPSFCLLIGLLAFQKRTQLIALCIYMAIFVFLFKDFWFYGKIQGYYTNFVRFTTNQETVDQYRNFFDGSMVQTYDLAQYINTHAKQGDSLFVWGNNGQLYRLTNTLPPEKYIVEYWLASTPNILKETKAVLQQSKPKFVIIMPHDATLPYSLDQYKPDIEVNNAMIYERID